MTYESTSHSASSEIEESTGRKGKSTDGAAIINLLNTIVGKSITVSRF